MQTQLFPSRGWTSCCCNLILLHLVFNCITLHHLHTVTALFIGDSVLCVFVVVVSGGGGDGVGGASGGDDGNGMVMVLLLVLEGKNGLLGYFEKAFTE